MNLKFKRSIILSNLAWFEHYDPLFIAQSGVEENL